MSTDPKSIKWYNENSKAYTNHVRNKNESVFHSLYEKPAMYSLFPDVKNKKVISLGCGSGEDSSYLKAQGALKSVGVDISEGMIKIATSSYLDCDFQVMDMEKLDFPDNNFEFAYSSLALHYIEDWTETFAEVFRILKAGSYFLFSCNHPVLSAMELVENREGLEGMELSFITNAKNKTARITGNYMERHSSRDTNVMTWHKPIGEILQEAYVAGFILDKFIDPKPLKEMEVVAPHHYKKLMKIPEFAIFRLKKP